MFNLNKLKAPTFSLSFSLALLLSAAGGLHAQTQQKPSTSPQPRPNDVITADKNSVQEDNTPLTTFEEEMKAKRMIKLAEKEHQENLTRAKEISEISHELQDTFKKRNAFDRDDVKKVERLEKLTRKIRGEAGGEDTEITVVNRPTDLPSAVARLGEVTETLSKNVQNTPRQVVSASVIDSANVLLELIKIIRPYIR